MCPGKNLTFSSRLMAAFLVLVSTSFCYAQDLTATGRAFLNSDEPFPVSSHELYVLHGTDASEPGDFLITFNLQERQTVQFELLDITGKRIMTEVLTDVLDQNHRVETKVASGVFILRIRIGNKYYVEKLYLA